MDKEQYTKIAKERGYTDETIEEIIQTYDELLKIGIDLDPTEFLVAVSGLPCGPRNRK